MHNIVRISIITLFICTFCFCSCKEDKSSFEIEGTLHNIEVPYFITAYATNDSTTVVDTIHVDKDGKFSFKGHIDTLSIMSMYFNHNARNTFILINKGWKIDVQGDALYPDLITVKGGSVNDDMTAFKEKNIELLKARAEILNQSEIKRFYNKQPAVSEEKNNINKLQNINFELANLAANYVKENPTKIASVLLINTFFKDETSIPRLDDNLDLLKGEAATFPLTQDLRNFSKLVKRSLVDSQAPFFTLKDIKGEQYSLYNSRGKYILLSFASTTCEVCNRERKDIIETYNRIKKSKMKDKVEFVTILSDTEISPVPKEVADSIKWTLLPEYGGWSSYTFELYNINELPYNILISPAGKILERDIPVQEIGGIIERYIKDDSKTE